MGKDKSKAGCLICGEDISYLSNKAQLNCAVCNEIKWADAQCLAGHFICDSCHATDSCTWIEQQCLKSDTTRPIEFAVELMRHPCVAMHGPEHHFLVPAVLLTAYLNLTQQSAVKKDKLPEARRRACNVVGGSCGFHGACGAAIGVGIFVSLVTNATPMSSEEWRLSNAATARTLTEIAEKGGPRCCKHSTFIALESAVSFSASHLAQALPKEQASCEFFRLNRECLGKNCDHFKAGRKTKLAVATNTSES